MEKTLITGGGGFIGSNLEGDVRLSSKDCDLRDYDETINCFKGHNPSVILHCAAHHGNYTSMHENPVEMFTDNMLININVLRAAKECGVKKLIAFSSVTAFPHQLDKPFSEADLYSGEPHPYTYAYAYAKRMVDVLVKTYREQYNLDYTCVLLSNVYGPKNDFNLETATVISKLIKMCHIAKTQNADFIIDGDGSPIRDFLYVEDVNTLTKKVLEQFDDSQYTAGSGRIIFSSGTSSTIKDIVNYIVKELRFEGRVVWDKNKPTGQSIKISDNSKLVSLYPDINFTSLEQGIKKTVQWFSAHKDDRVDVFEPLKRIT